MTALDFALTDVVAVSAMLLLATVLVRFERDTGLFGPDTQHSRARQNGAGKAGGAGPQPCARAGALYGVNLFYRHAYYGLGPLSRSVQSVPALMRTTLSLSVGQYIGLFLLPSGRRRLPQAHGDACHAGGKAAVHRGAGRGRVSGAEFAGARSLVPATSRWNVLKYANLVSLLRTNEFWGVTTTYTGLGSRWRWPW